MSDQQTTGLILLLVGLAALIVSAGIAWALSRRSRVRRVESTWFITAISVVLLVAGVVLCWFGVTTLLER
jgi:amino acid transporter